MTDDPFAYAGMSDAQVLRRAADHYQRAARFATGSQRRAVEWAKFTAAYGEYRRRQDACALRRVALAGGHPGVRVLRRAGAAQGA